MLYALMALFGGIIALSVFTAGYIVGSKYAITNRATGTPLDETLMEAVTPRTKSKIVSPAKKAYAKAFEDELNENATI